MRQHGAIVFDVDDTLLERRKNVHENDQVFSESSAAMSLIRLLELGVRVCLITGHGWTQLEDRLVKPLIKELLQTFPDSYRKLATRFFVYANRGATKIIWQGEQFKEDENHGKRFALNDSDLDKIDKVFSELNGIFCRDFAKKEILYRQKFEQFNFNELPPKIIGREKVVLGLRPIPSEWHSKRKSSDSPRQKLFEKGVKLLKENGLDAKYDLSQSGKSTLEITHKSVSKEIAFSDIIETIAKENRISTKQVEESSIYIGDEFFVGGNDFIIAERFPKTLCISVSPATKENIAGNVVFSDKIFQVSGTKATAGLIEEIIKFLI